MPESILGHELYLSEEEVMVSLTNMQGCCYMKYFEMSATSQEKQQWSEEGPNQWFFREVFCPSQ